MLSYWCESTVGGGEQSLSPAFKVDALSLGQRGGSFMQ